MNRKALILFACLLCANLCWASPSALSDVKEVRQSQIELLLALEQERETGALQSMDMLIEVEAMLKQMQRLLDASAASPRRSVSEAQLVESQLSRIHTLRLQAYQGELIAELQHKGDIDLATR